jgi:restriction system protein
MAEKTIWGIHAGKTGDADTLFLKKNYIAIGWKEMGNLSQNKATREVFKTGFIKAYPTSTKPGAIRTGSGQPYRFVHEMKEGDIVLYPSKKDRHIHIGQVEGHYQYNPSIEVGYPNQRAVRWIKAFPRTSFTQGALYEIGSAMSLFQVKNYADEFLTALEGKIPPLSTGEDETVAIVEEDIEQSTRDFILKRLAQDLKGHPFAHFVAHLLGAMGYRTRVSEEGPDSGIDILAHKDELGFEPPIIKVQVKRYRRQYGGPSCFSPIRQSQPGRIWVISHTWYLYESSSYFRP